MSEEPRTHSHALLTEPGRFRELVLDRDEAAPRLPWLEQAREDPAAFLARLFELCDSRGVRAAKSEPGVAIDLYHDLVLRHTDGERIALHYRERGEWKTRTFSELHGDCHELSRIWTSRGVTAGQSLALIRPAGAAGIIELLTGLRIGLVVTLIEPLGDRFIQRRLAAIEPDWIVVEEHYERLIPDMLDRVLSPTPGPEEPVERLETRVSEPDEVVLRLFSAVDGDPLNPVDLRAEDVLLHALRDGLLGLGLRPDDVLVDIELPRVKYQPTLLFAALAAGAATVLLSREEIESEPALAGAFPNTTIILDPALRDRLQRAEPPLGESWTTILRDPSDRLEWHRWKDFLDTHELNECPIANIAVDACRTGIALFSFRRAGAINSSVLPAPDLVWSVGDVPPTLFSSLSRTGVLARIRGRDVRMIGTILLAEFGAEWLYVGTAEPRRSGLTYPEREALDALEELDWLKGASVVARAGGSEADPWRFGLLLFLGAIGPDELDRLRPRLIGEVETTLRRHVGAHAFPDELIFLPLYPRRRAKGEMDHEWARREYLSGSLQRRSEHPLFGVLQHARQSVMEDPPAPSI